MSKGVLKKSHPQQNSNSSFSSESDDESTSDDEDDNASGADRELRKQHAEEIEKYIDWERSNLTRLFSEFPDGTKLTRKKARCALMFIALMTQLTSRSFNQGAGP